MRLTIFVFLIQILSFLSCSSVINSEGHKAFDEKGTLLADCKNLDISSTDSIDFYIEASGSMNGFFRSNKSTLFKKDVWAIVSDFPNIDSVWLFEKMNSFPVPLTLNDFRNQMNAGTLISSYSTDIPSMLKTILFNLEQSHCNVAVLISDLKYSPVGSGPLSVLLDQYQTEIRNLFKNSNYGINLICAKSDFLGKDGTVQCDQSPYYYMVIGKERFVISVSDRISENLEANGDFIGEVAYNINYETPQYTALPYKNVSNMQNISSSRGCYTFTNYMESDGGATFWIALNVKQLPRSLREAEVIRNQIEAKGSYGSIVKVEEITNKLELGNFSDKELVKQIEANLFIKVSVKDMIMQSEVIQLKINGAGSDISWSNSFCDAQSEADCSKTYSLREFLKGLEDATMNYPYQKEPVYILVSKKNI